MNRAIKLVALAPALAFGMSALASQARASTVELTFGDLVNAAPIGSWFNGGTNPFYTGSANNGPQTGPADGVVFSSNAEELRAGVSGHAPSGGSGKFENNPGGVNSYTGKAGVLYFGFSSTSSSYLNDAGGFDQISFNYSILNNTATYDDTVDLYSGLNGTGNLLGSLSLTPNGTAVACQTTGDEFCTWSLASASNFGIAESAVFGGPSSTPLEGLEFDAVSLSGAPGPAVGAGLPGVALAAGVIGLVGLRRKRKAAAAA